MNPLVLNLGAAWWKRGGGVGWLVGLNRRSKQAFLRRVDELRNLLLVCRTKHEENDLIYRDNKVEMGMRFWMSIASVISLMMLISRVYEDDMRVKHSFASRRTDEDASKTIKKASSSSPKPSSSTCPCPCPCPAASQGCEMSFPAFALSILALSLILPSWSGIATLMRLQQKALGTIVIVLTSDFPASPRTTPVSH